MDYVKESVTVTENILHDEYYVDRFFRSLDHHKMTIEGIYQEQYSARDLISLFNTFWAALPDSGSIRCSVFFQVCDIAEGMFDEPDGPDELNSVSTTEYQAMHDLANDDNPF